MMSIETLLILVLVLVPAAVVGVPAVLSVWPLLVGVSLATLIVGTNFAKAAARRIVAGENRAQAEGLQLQREELNKERAELTAKARGLDYERQLLRREAAVVAQERQALAAARQLNDRKAGELVGARQHIRRLTKKPDKPPEGDE